MHDVAVSTLWPEAQKFHRLDDVEHRNNALLDAEPGHLDLLHDVVAPDEHCRAVEIPDVGPVREDRRGDVEDDGIYDDHVEDSTQDLLVPEDEMEA